MPEGWGRKLGGSNMGLEGISWTSRPAVKALGPAPERIMARVRGSRERKSNIVRRSSHILVFGGKMGVSVGCWHLKLAFVGIRGAHCLLKAFILD